MQIQITQRMMFTWRILVAMKALISKSHIGNYTTAYLAWPFWLEFSSQSLHYKIGSACDPRTTWNKKGRFLAILALEVQDHNQNIYLTKLFTSAASHIIQEHFLQISPKSDLIDVFSGNLKAHWIFSSWYYCIY